MTDILLTHSFFLRFDPKQWKTMQPYPPLGTLYAASVLRRSGLSVALFDSMLASSEEELSDQIVKHKPSIVAIYDDSFNYLTKMCLGRMRMASYRMIHIAKLAGCRVIVAGSDATDHAREYLEEGADYVILGEGEFTLAELCPAILNTSGVFPASINGIAFLSGDQIEVTQPRSPLKDLDNIPLPAWDLVDVGLYREKWERHGYFSLNVVTTRGCPFGCNWCAKPIYGRVYNSRSPANVVGEIEMLRNKYRVNHIWFCDDIFGLRPGWIDEFAGEIKRRGIKISYKCLSRPDLLLKENTFESLAESGCEIVWIGAESGEQTILDAMEKGTTVAQIREATRRLRKNGIKVGYFLQFGYPGEDYSGIMRTVGLVLDEMPDEIGISVSYPMPGTKFYEMVRSGLGKKRNWYDSDDLDLLFPGQYSPRFYRVLHRVVHKLYRIRRILMKRERWNLRSLMALSFHVATLPFYYAGMRLTMTRNHYSFRQPEETLESK